MSEDAPTRPFVPLRQRRRGEQGAAEYTSLHEGVPAWLLPTVIEWIRDQLSDHAEDVGLDRSYSEWNRDRLRALERALRLPLKWDNGTEGAGLAVLRHAAGDGDLCLEIVNYLLHRFDMDSAVQRDVEDVLALIEALGEAGSAWNVALVESSDRLGLERRVDETVAAAAAGARDAGRPGRHLALAWEAAYGRTPDASKAYRESVRAVESAAIGVLAPKNPKATLGVMISYLRDAPDKWAMTNAGRDPISALRSMLELLWTGQTDRHGTDDPDTPLEVSTDEARTAVHLAVTLVHWFTSGAVKIV